MIEIDSKSIQKAITDIKKQYSHISGDILNQAVSRALNRTASSGRTEANKQIRVTYNISAARINKDFKTRNSNPKTLTAQIIASGNPLSFNNFGAKQIGSTGTTGFDRKGVASSRLNRKSRNNAAKGVSVAIKRGKIKQLPMAFIQVANGGITVFSRGKYKNEGEGFDFKNLTSGISPLSAPSVPLMFANNSVIEPTLNKTLEVFNDRITVEIKNLLR